jgi:DNA (cytosine-5)-methyltransferase 1
VPSGAAAGAPDRPGRKLLHEFLTATEPLSTRATAGFLSRTRKSSLRFPPGFLEAVQRHLTRRTEETAVA